MKKNIKEISMVGGVFVALNIGAGFASGQELFQVFTSYGLQGFIGSVISFIILLYASESVIDAGWVNQECKKKSVFDYFCGDKIGQIYNIIVPFILYGNFLIMLSGAGVVLEEFFHIPNWIGRFIVVSLVILSIFTNFKSMAAIVSKLGKFIALILVIICFIIIFKQGGNIFENNKLLQNISVLKVADSFYGAAILYASMIVLLSSQFLFEIGKTLSERRIGFYGIFLGIIVFIGSAVIVHLAMLLNLNNIYSIKIKTLYFAQQISPILAVILAILLPIVMSSASITNFWAVGNILAKVLKLSGMLFYILLVLLAIIGFFFAKIPFDRLINILQPLNGSFGIFFICCIIYKQRKISYESNKA